MPKKLPKNRVLLNNDQDRILKAFGLIFLYVNIDTLKSILAFFQMIGSRILGYTEWEKWSFLGFSCQFFRPKQQFLCKIHQKFGKNDKFYRLIKTKTKISFCVARKNLFSKNAHFLPKNILVKNRSKFLLGKLNPTNFSRGN